eukprot:m.100117 g.100117  ORF g.100117 m.100117 type:complete len:166 (-) comp27221_c1_seq3:199-696(-)
MSRPKRRLLKEFSDAQQTNRGDAGSKSKLITLTPQDESTLMVWRAILVPESPSLYEGGTFVLSIKITANYPIEPPDFRFVTIMCHPNIHARTGEICLDVLKAEWSPAWTLHAACLAILLLLDNPDPTSPLNCDAGNLIRGGDTRGYRSLVKLFTKLHATENQLNN